MPSAFQSSLVFIALNERRIQKLICKGTMNTVNSVETHEILQRIASRQFMCMFIIYFLGLSSFVPTADLW